MKQSENPHISIFVSGEDLKCLLDERVNFQKIFLLKLFQVNPFACRRS